MMSYTRYRWAGAAVTAIGLFATSVAGQPPRPAPLDPLETAKTQKSIAQQKAEAQAEVDARQAIDNATQQAKRAELKPKAVQALRTAKANLQLAPGLSDATRTRLTALLDAKLAVIEGRTSTTTPPLTAPGFKLDPKTGDVKAAKEAVVARDLAEFRDVRQGIERVSDYEARGMTAQAAAEIARLTKTYPTNPSVLSLGYTDTLKNRLADAQALYAEAASRWVINQRQIRESALPAIYDVEFPKNWKKLSEERLKSNQPQMTDREKKIIEALDKSITVNFTERPFEEALQDLSNMLDQPLLVDKKSLDDLGIDLKKGSTLQAKGLAGRTVLRALLATQGLTFVIKDQTIQIVSVERAKTMLTTRVYSVADLVQGVGPFGNPLFGPAINAQQAQANVNLLIDAIKKIDPLSWAGEAGGPGTITYHAPTQSIIVRNSAEVHLALSSALSPKNNK
jgi:hypothetical protein